MTLDGHAGQKFESTWPAGRLSNWSRILRYAGFQAQCLREQTRMDSSVEVQGKQLKLSNLEKVLYPATGFTKQQVIDY
jgi:hypothetical protein